MTDGNLFQGYGMWDISGEIFLIQVHTHPDDGKQPVFTLNHGFYQYTRCLSVIPINIIWPFD